MRNLKTVFILLLAFALLIAGSCFPYIVSALQDSANLEKLAFNEIRQVQLQIDREIPALGRLALLDRMESSLTINGVNASMTEEQVLQAASLQLQPYLDAGLIQSLDHRAPHLEPCLVQAADDPELSGVIWMVTLAPEKDSKRMYGLIQLAIDDKTGTVLMIDYTVEDPSEPYDYEQMLDTFASIYFTSLGIIDYSDFESRALNGQFVGDNAVARRYSFGDSQYGQVTVDLYVYQHGFYTQTQ